MVADSDSYDGWTQEAMIQSRKSIKENSYKVAAGLIQSVGVVWVVFMYKLSCSGPSALHTEGQDKWFNVNKMYLYKKKICLKELSKNVHKSIYLLVQF